MLFGSLIHELYFYRTAKVICENSILEIDVTINNLTEKVKHSNKGLSINISCFGALIGGEIVSYNINGRKLKSISISPDYLEISYVERDITRSVKILHGVLTTEEIARIKQHFLYETGITPLVSIDDNTIF